MTCKSFLGVTVHYIEESTLSSFCLGVKELSERHTMEYIEEMFEHILVEWKISKEKVVAVVTDNGANIVSAVHQCFGKNKHIPCFAHTINLVAEKSTKHPEISNLVDKVRNIVKHVKNSVNINDQLRKKQINGGVSEGQVKKLILDVKTRWNSMFYMIERFLELSVTLRLLMQLLRPIEHVTREASAEKYVSASKIIPMINCLMKQYDRFQYENNMEDIAQAAKIIKTEIQKRFGYIEYCTPIAAATILDPRFKTIHFKDPQATAQIISFVRQQIEADLRNCTDSESDTDSVSSIQQRYEDEFWSHHKNLAHGHGKKIKKKIGTDDEVSIYLSNSVSALSTEPLKQWDDMKPFFPVLYKQSLKYLTIMATSVPSERLFSKAGAIATQTRNRITGKRLNKLLFLGSVKEIDWF